MLFINFNSIYLHFSFGVKFFRFNLKVGVAKVLAEHARISKGMLCLTLEIVVSICIKEWRTFTLPYTGKAHGKKSDIISCINALVSQKFIKIDDLSAYKMVSAIQERVLNVPQHCKFA